MWPYLITFELTDRARREPALSAVLRDMGAVALTASAWLMTSDWNACAILEQLRPIVGKDDRLLVLEISEDIAALNLKHPMLAGATLVSEVQN
ncbi:MAG: hypothetical protein WAM39_31840 [Bryobacteraceae bacterium]